MNAIRSKRTDLPSAAATYTRFSDLEVWSRRVVAQALTRDRFHYSYCTFLIPAQAWIRLTRGGRLDLLSAGGSFDER